MSARWSSLSWLGAHNTWLGARSRGLALTTRVSTRLLSLSCTRRRALILVMSNVPQALSQAHRSGPHDPPFLWAHAAMRARALAAGASTPPRLLTYHLDRCLDGGACKPKQRAALQTALRTCEALGVADGAGGHVASEAAADGHVAASGHVSSGERAAIVTLVAEGGGWLEGARTLACSIPPSPLMTFGSPTSMVRGMPSSTYFPW